MPGNARTHTPADPYGKLPLLSTYALELQVVRHCNLRCKGCAQSSPDVFGLDQLAVLKRSLGNLSSVLSCQKVQVIGGEPTLHPDIDGIMQAARASGIAPSVVVKTNGLKLLQMSSVFWTIADRVIVSVYPDTARAITAQRASLTEVAERHGAAIEFRMQSEFREILKDSVTGNARIVQEIFDRCEYKTFTHSLQGSRLYRCSPSVNIGPAFGEDAADDRDSINVLNRRRLRERVSAFLLGASPLRTCDRCLGSSGTAFPHQMVART